MVKLVWDLVQPTSPPKNLILGFVVVILCHIKVGHIHPWVIHTDTDPIVRHILVGRIIVLLLVIVEVF